MKTMQSDEGYEAALEKANFCLVTGIAPSEYDNMTQTEVAAFTEAWNKLQKEANRR